MTRHQRFDVRLAPEVAEAVCELAERPGAGAAQARRLRTAIWHLSVEGTRASGAKKLRSLDLWEIRVGDYRVFFCPVRRTKQVAVATMLTKTVRRLPMRRQKHIEAKVLDVMGIADISKRA